MQNTVELVKDLAQQCATIEAMAGELGQRLHAFVGPIGTVKMQSMQGMQAQPKQPKTNRAQVSRHMASSGTVRQKLLTALKSSGGLNYGLLAKATYGDDSAISRRNVRANLHSMKAQGLVRRGAGGAWQVQT